MASDKRGKSEFVGVARLSPGRCFEREVGSCLIHRFCKTLGHQLIRDFQCSASDLWVHEAEVAITFRERRKIKGKPGCGNCIDDQRWSKGQVISNMIYPTPDASISSSTRKWVAAQESFDPAKKKIAAIFTPRWVPSITHDQSLSLVTHLVILTVSHANIRTSNVRSQTINLRPTNMSSRPPLTTPGSSSPSRLPAW